MLESALWHAIGEKACCVQYYCVYLCVKDSVLQDCIAVCPYQINTCLSFLILEY